MNVWKNVQLSALYTLSPTHCGASQAKGAVDLPIQREAHTGFPVLPASALKGVARDRLERALTKDHKDIRDLFGPEEDGKLSLGGLAWTDGRLVAYPARSLKRPFVHVTCAAVLENLVRDLRLLGLSGFVDKDWSVPHAPDRALVADASLAGDALVIEDLVYAKEQVAVAEALGTLGQRLAELLPAAEEDTRARLRSGLVLVPDDDFMSLMARVPVRARIKLNDKKTTGKGDDESGNLWYEEYLPPECLFISIMGERAEGTLARFQKHEAKLQVLQIGGSETVGQGLCCCTFWHGGAA